MSEKATPPIYPLEALRLLEGKEKEDYLVRSVGVFTATETHKMSREKMIMKWRMQLEAMIVGGYITIGEDLVDIALEEVMDEASETLGLLAEFRHEFKQRVSAAVNPPTTGMYL